MFIPMNRILCSGERATIHHTIKVNRLIVEIDVLKIAAVLSIVAFLFDLIM